MSRIWDHTRNTRDQYFHKTDIRKSEVGQDCTDVFRRNNGLKARTNMQILFFLSTSFVESRASLTNFRKLSIIKKCKTWVSDTMMKRFKSTRENVFGWNSNQSQDFFAARASSIFFIFFCVCFWSACWWWFVTVGLTPKSWKVQNRRPTRGQIAGISKLGARLNRGCLAVGRSLVEASPAGITST